MAGMEGERPQPRAAAFDAGAPGGNTHWKRQNADERHVGNAEIHTHSYREVLNNDLELRVPVRLKNGEPVDVAHLYMESEGFRDKNDNTNVFWWIERELVANWQERIRAAHEKGIRAYKDVSEHHTPSVVTHTYQGSRGYYTDYGYHSENDVGHMVVHYPTSQETLDEQSDEEPHATQVYPATRPIDADIVEYTFSASARDLLIDAGDVMGVFHRLGKPSAAEREEEKARREQARKANQPDPHLEFLARLRQQGKLES